MITIGFCTREHDEKFVEHLKKSCGLNNVEIIEIVNHGDRSLTECFNEILKKSKYNIVVLLHNDIDIKTPNWGNKLLKHYKRNPEIGIMGVAGTKNLPKSGRWWDNPKKLFGQVYHTHEGKTWLTEFNADQGNKLEDVVIVDGVFFSLDKTKIKCNFDENVEGFHFYDLSFCFDNYLAGVKIGVHTDIKINHRSIGVTNEEWERNRLLFANKYSENLPADIPIDYSKHKIKVLIGCLNFATYTGSEIYFYELAKELIKQGCDVTVCSNVNGPLARQANAWGIKTVSIQEPPGFKLGDGKWSLKTPNGDVLSKENTLYPIKPIDFDIMHLSHKPITEHLMKLYQNIPVISTIHSEVIDLEHPIINDRIKKYIAIRPEIKEFLIDRFSISDDKIDVVYNPIDYNRFKPMQSIKKRDKKRLLFVGTMDYLRENAIKDLITHTLSNDMELWLVGKNNGIDLNKIIGQNKHVKYFEPTWTVENYIKECDEVASILLGRTLIEGWMCGKIGWIYDVDNYGTIISKKIYEPPTDIDKFRNDIVVKEIISLYKLILK